MKHLLLSTGAPRHRFALAIATLALVMASCSSDANDSSKQIDAGPPPAQAGADVDDSAQPLDAVVADAVAPVGGSSAANLARVSIWGGQALLDACNQPFFGREGDRFDQVRFPDFDRIADDGIGVLESFDNPVEDPVRVEGPEADPACREQTLPAFVAGEALRGQWFETIVYPLWESPSTEQSKAEVTACLNVELSGTLETIPSLDAFFTSVDSAAREITGTEEQRRSKIAALDQAAVIAFADCGRDFYGDLEAQLSEARESFLDQHGEAVQDLARELDEYGYVP